MHGDVSRIWREAGREWDRVAQRPLATDATSQLIRFLTQPGVIQATYACYKLCRACADDGVPEDLSLCLIDENASWYQLLNSLLMELLCNVPASLKRSVLNTCMSPCTIELPQS